MGGGRGQHIEATRRRQILDGIEQAKQAGARQAHACELLGLSSRTPQRWQKTGDLRDKRTETWHVPSNKLSEAERQRIVAIANSPTYAGLGYQVKSCHAWPIRVNMSPPNRVFTAF